MRRNAALRWSQLKVGILIVVGFVILIWVAFNSELPSFVRREEPLVARFPNAEGLVAGAPVVFLGLESGNVNGIEFDPEKGAAPIRVTFSVTPKIREELRSDASVRVSSLGLLGEKFLELRPGTAATPLAPAGVLPGTTETRLADLIEPGTRTLSRVDSLIGDLEAISSGLRGGEGSLGKLLSRDELHERLVGTLEAARATLVDTRAALEATRTTLADMRRTQSAVGTRLASAAGSFDSLATGWRRSEGTLNRIVEDPALYENLTATAERLDRVLAQVEQGDGLLSRMLRDPELANEVTRLVVDVRALLTDMRENPGRYVQFSLF